MFLLHFIIPILLRVTVWLGIEDRTRWRERVGQCIRAPKNNLKDKIIWFHVSSIGELNSIRPLLGFLSDKYQDCSFLITSYTRTCANMLDSLNLNNVVQQYVPLDTPQSVKAFLARWRPHFAIFVESEIWPILLVQTSKICPVIMLNARFSERGWRKWQLIKPALIKMLKRFNGIITCSKMDYDRIVSLDKEYFTPRTHFFCNIKYFCEDMEFNKAEYSYLKKYWKERKIWVCSSTHYGEEMELLKIHTKLKQDIPRLLTIIVPRHPSKAHEVMQQALKANLNCEVYSRYSSNISSTFSKQHKIKRTKVSNTEDDNVNLKELDILVVDFIGRLGTFYRLADSVFIGGSLVSRGGQNVLEPLQLGKCVIIGKYYNNFSDIVEAAANAGILKVAPNINELALDVQNDLSRENFNGSQSKTADQIKKFTYNMKTQNFNKLCRFFERYM